MEKFNALWESYRSCWDISNAEQRNGILCQIMSKDFQYRDPNVELTGYKELSQYMSQFQKEFEGASFIITNFRIHHNRSLANWNMVNSQNAVVVKGVDFAVFENGKLQEITGFFK